jgi:hypothetical protein
MPGRTQAASRRFHPWPGAVFGSGLLLVLFVLLAGGAEASAASVPYLEISTSRTRVQIGSEVNVTVKLQTRSGALIRGGDIRLEYAFPGHNWTALTEFETDSSGRHSESYGIPATVDLRAHFRGSSRFASTTTGSIRVATYAGIPPDGSEYWNPKDGCGYVVENGTWVGKICKHQIVDSSGHPIEDLFNLYEYSATSPNHAGNFMAELLANEPGWFKFRIPSNPLFQAVLWAATKESEPTAPPIYEVNIGGTTKWISGTELEQDLQAQQAAAAGQQAPPPSSNTVVISGGDTTFQSILGGISGLGTSEDAAQTFGSLYGMALNNALVLPWVE